MPKPHSSTSGLGPPARGAKGVQSVAKPSVDVAATQGKTQPKKGAELTAAQLDAVAGGFPFKMRPDK